MTTYILTLSEKQSHTIIIALQEFVSLRNNDWTAFLTEMCTNKSQVNDAVKTFEEIMSAACNGKPYWDTDNMDLAHKLSKLAERQQDMLLSEDKAKFVRNILEEYFRLRLNQWFDFTTDVATAGYIYDKTNPDNGRLFDKYIARRNNAQERFTETFGKLRDPFARQTDDMLRAQEIWQVIRHRLYIDKGGDPNGWCVDARPPMSLTGEKLPAFTVI